MLKLIVKRLVLPIQISLITIHCPAGQAKLIQALFTQYRPIHQVILSARLSRDEFLMQNSGILVHRSHSAIKLPSCEK